MPSKYDLCLHDPPPDVVNLVACYITVYGTFMPRELSCLRTFLPVNFRAREPNPNTIPNPNPGTGELSRLGTKVPLARKFRLPYITISDIFSVE